MARQKYKTNVRSSTKNVTNVSSMQAATADAVLASLQNSLFGLTPELAKAATYVLENPNSIGVTSIREVAKAADVHPNTLVRMARAVGFEGYEDFRRPFREEIKRGRESFPDRARWLQSLAKGGKLGGLYAEMAESTLSNVEGTFASADAKHLKAAADALIAARRSYVLGVGIAHPLAVNFAYLAGMAVDNIQAIPRDGSLPADDLARAGHRDILLAMTFKPFRTEVVEAVRIARAQGVEIIAISDSPAAPIINGARHAFVIPTVTLQHFTSIVAVTAFLETLMAFLIADASPQVIANIEAFHRRRHDLGIYWPGKD